jgi:hypothetical protein
MYVFSSIRLKYVAHVNWIVSSSLVSYVYEMSLYLASFSQVIVLCCLYACEIQICLFLE